MLESAGLMSLRFVVLMLFAVAAGYMIWSLGRHEQHMRAREEAQKQYLTFMQWQLRELSKRSEDQQRKEEILASLYRPVESWEDVMEIAQLYQLGAFPDYRPTPSLAATVYHGVIAKCDKDDVVLRARQRLHECMTHAVAEEDISGQPFPPQVAHEVVSYIQSIPSPRKHHHEHHHGPAFKTPKAAGPKLVNIVSDTQNAHDHGVTSSIRTTLATLGETKDIDEALSGVEQSILSSDLDMTDEEKAKALTVLQSLGADHTHSTLGVSEQEALARVWMSLDALADTETKRNAKETLCKQLASGYERGAVVCSTGKIARIVGALDGIPDTSHVTAKPMWAVQEELGTLAAKVRTEVLEKANETDQRAYVLGTSIELEDAMKSRFRDEARAQYCEKLGMSEAIIDPLISSISDGF